MDLSSYKLEDLKGRAARLPSMFQRHGPLQVMLYLQSKSDEDHALGQWVWKVLKEINPGSPLVKVDLFNNKKVDIKLNVRVMMELFKTVSEQPIQLRLRDQAACAEIATWLYRTIAALCALSSGRPDSKGANDE